MNCFFGTGPTKHRTLSGYVIEPRAKAFEANESGFRGLLAATNVRELNEKQWEFFRYMVFEVVHSKMAAPRVLEILNAPENAKFAVRYREVLPSVLEDIETLRNRYFDAAFNTATKAPDFKREVDIIEMTAKMDGKSDSEITQLIEQEIAKKRALVIEICKSHLKASLGRLDSPTQVLKRLSPSSGSAERDGEAMPEIAADDRERAEGLSEEGLKVALVADDLRHQPPDENGRG